MALYTELPVYRDTYQLILKVFEYTKDFPIREHGSIFVIIGGSCSLLLDREQILLNKLPSCGP